MWHNFPAHPNDLHFDHSAAPENGTPPDKPLPSESPGRSDQSAPTGPTWDTHRSALFPDAGEEFANDMLRFWCRLQDSNL